MVSLTMRGRSHREELLLVLLGQRSLRNKHAVAGNEITNGLRLSGRVIHRVDYELDKMTTAGDVVTMGKGRARRYRLTNQGLVKAGPPRSRWPRLAIRCRFARHARTGRDS